MNPLVAIVVACFNDADHLEQTLSSIASQSDIGGAEVIISDGGSSDRTSEVLYQCRDLIARVRSGPDSGVYHAMNLGAELASAEWLHFLNAGDYFVAEDSYSRVARKLTLTGQHWLIARAENRHAAELLGVTQVVIPSVPYKRQRHAFGIQPHCHQATWVRTRIFNESGGFALNAGTAADHRFILRMGRIGSPAVVNDVIISYEGAGMSFRNRRATARLLHANRVSEFKLGKQAAAVDAGVAVVLDQVNRLRASVGRWRRGSQRG